MSAINLSTPQDIIAAVPYLLGFHPDDSLVVMALTARQIVVIFRYDLPDPDADNDRRPTGELVDRLSAELAERKTDAVVLLGYGTVDRARPVLDAATAHLADLLTISEALLVTGARFWSLLCACCSPPDGIEFDSAATVTAAELTTLGFAPFDSRDAMRESIAPLAGAAARAMQAAVDRAAANLPLVGADGPDSRHLARLRQLLAAAAPLSDADAADLIVLLGYLRLRDEAWVITEAGDPDEQVAFWTDLTQRTPADRVAAPASLLAYAAACLTGDGVLARIAVDHALAVEPDYSLAQLIEMMLDSGVQPSRCRIGTTAADLDPIPGPPAS